MIKNLIKAIHSDDTLESMKQFESIWNQKVSDALQAKRVQVGREIFGESIEEPEDELTLEDFSEEELLEYIESEEFQQLDEISKKTLGNYINKAAEENKLHWGKSMSAYNNADIGTAGKHLYKSKKRSDGISSAVKKLVANKSEHTHEVHLKDGGEEGHEGSGRTFRVIKVNAKTNHDAVAAATKKFDDEMGSTPGHGLSDYHKKNSYSAPNDEHHYLGHGDDAGHMWATVKKSKTVVPAGE